MVFSIIFKRRAAVWHCDNGGPAGHAYKINNRLLRPHSRVCIRKPKPIMYTRIENNYRTVNGTNVFENVLSHRNSSSEIRFCFRLPHVHSLTPPSRRYICSQRDGGGEEMNGRKLYPSPVYNENLTGNNRPLLSRNVSRPRSYCIDLF